MSDDRSRELSELEALLALDALDAAEQIDAELAHGPFVPELAVVTTALAETAVTAAPRGLRAGVLDAAVGDRPAGPSLRGVEPLDPAAACRLFVGELAAVLEALTADDWSRPAHPAYGTVHDLIAHLVGVEEIVLGWVGAAPLDANPDHVAATRPMVEALAGLPGAELAARWHTAALEALAAATAADPAAPVDAHGIPTDVDGMLVLRSFELWTHADDIRRACGRELPAPDAAAMSLLSQRLLRVAGMAPVLRGHEAPSGRVRFVLTGTGGGTYDVTVGSGDGAEATIVVDVVDLCRAASRRLPVDELAWALDGDEALAHAALADIDAFARD